MFKFKTKKQTKKASKKSNLFFKMIFSKFGVMFVVLLAFFIFLYVSLLNYITNSDYFKVDTVEIKGQNLSTLYLNKDVFSLGKGKNILLLNLRDVHRELMKRYPEIEDLKVIRMLPNKLIFRIKAPKPFAQISYNNKFYPVDRESFLLSNISQEAYKGLPVIRGINSKLNDFVGRQCVSRQMTNSFLLLDAMKSTGFLKDHDLLMVDASDYKNISFYIEDGVEIKIGGDNFKERLNLLKKTFNDPKLVRSEIKYLDLRFEDVTIGPKAIK